MIPRITWETRRTSEETLQSMVITFRIGKKLEKEAFAGEAILSLFAQTDGVTSGQAFGTLLAILEKLGIPPDLYDGGDRKIITSNFLRSLEAKKKGYFDISGAGLRCRYRTESSWCSVLEITQFQDRLVIPWSGCADAFAALPGFMQAILVDEAYDCYQNEDRLNMHIEAKRNTDKLVLLPEADSHWGPMIDVSRNPGRRATGFGYLEMVGTTMRLGVDFWAIAGIETKARLLAGPWPEATELNGGTLLITAAPRCFDDEDDVMKVAAAWSVRQDDMDSEKHRLSHLLVGWLPETV